ncbi:transcriptional regulator, XRE family [Catenulispora acidiphila DSM 44928]|uniref:Transcriptional regulator, XRE family n=1 Tax=Catenulispora acidiphila (strain DSM 44928 / JCM 14897 / NBRC 102108 / NRRL B-24433 / ID139908) TaxID=479433 RepID=C7QC27_CATAD|nr:helix-turn-helix domain-containing protein [Catenulispora acidiphila]ACU72646.1 transcriptional regulator, XRE family [Catenulispora acidiphila DSM 44928]
MEPSPREQPGTGHRDSLVSAASSVTTSEELAELLRDLRRRHARRRRDRKLTYRELAAETGWSQTAIAEYFTARTLPPTDRFDALLEVLGVSPAEQRALATARDRVEEVNRRTGNRRGARRPEPGPERVSPPGTVAHRLPAAPPLFTGRARELAWLDAALGAALDERTRADDRPRVCAIGGMGGIGKTWLALHWANQHLDRFPDGQLYVDLRGFDPAGQPMAPTAAVRGFLEALGVAPSAIPAARDARFGLYRSLTAGRRMLILLDNARDTAQVTPLLPGSDACTVLITSRPQLAGLIATHGVSSVALDVLPRDEARRLLSRYLGRARLDAEPQAADALLACCAGLPLAVGIVAARATIHSDLSLGALAAELGEDAYRLDGLDAGEPQADLRGVLSWSSRALSPDAARAFGLLGIAPGPDLGQTAAASLLALTVAKTRTVLRMLEHSSLIERHAPERYRMHDLVRLYAAEQAAAQHAPAEVQAAQRRLADSYVRTAYEAVRLFADRPVPLAAEPVEGSMAHSLADPASAMAWFDTEHTNLLAAQRTAQSLGWDEAVYLLAWTLDPYHRRRGHLESQATAWELAVTSARSLPDQALRILAHHMLGDAYAQLGRTADALRALHEALTMAEQADDVSSQGEIHHSLGGAWERHGDDRHALEHARRAVLIFQSLDDLYRQARGLNGVGWLQARIGEHMEARTNCQAALALLRRLPSDDQRVGESDILDSLGFIAHRLHEYDRALEHFRQALAICRAQGHSYLEPDILHHIAETHCAQCNIEQARDTWQRAHTLYAEQHRLTDASRVQQRLDALPAPAAS